MSTGTAARKAAKKAAKVTFRNQDVILALFNWWTKPGNANKALPPDEKIFTGAKQDWTIRTVIKKGWDGRGPGGILQVQPPAN